MNRRELSPIDALLLSIARAERALEAKQRGRARKRKCVFKRTGIATRVAFDVP